MFLQKTATALGNGSACKPTICTVTAATFIWTSIRLLLSSSGDDACKIGSLESRTADKTAVDVLLCKKFGSVARLHGATVLDTDRLSRLGSDELRERLADKGMDLLRRYSKVDFDRRFRSYSRRLLKIEGW